MARTLSTIYNSAVTERNKYLKLTELTNTSKMSIIDAITYVASSLVYSFETILDVFTVDMANTYANRINGTPGYYANALLKFQYGDALTVSSDGSQFQYSSVDTTKRIITKVAYEEKYASDFKDNVLVLKVAKGDVGSLARLNTDELTAATAYINQIKFAGVNTGVISRIGDVLVPRVTVYYDGKFTEDVLRTNVQTAIDTYIYNMGFDTAIFVQNIIDAIKGADNVTDVYIDPNATQTQGIYMASYDDNDALGTLTKIDRVATTSSGYLKESSVTGLEAALPTFANAITVKLETE